MYRNQDKGTFNWKNGVIQARRQVNFEFDDAMWAPQIGRTGSVGQNLGIKYGMFMTNSIF